MSEVGVNWAGNYRFGAAELRRPESVEELQALVIASPRIRALGTRHSFNDLADTTGTLVSLVEREPEPRLDTDRMTVSVAAGTRYGVLASWLADRGFALHNMGSLPHISVAGAIATGTHGSGNALGNLSTAVAGLQSVTGEGTLLEVDRSDPQFDGMVVSLGALGIVTRVTLDIQPSFDVRQDVYTGLPWDNVLAEFEQITAAAYSVSLFTDWRGDSLQSAWFKTRLAPGESGSMPPTLFGTVASTAEVSLVEGESNTTVQGGIPGPWSERLPHFRLDSTPSNGDELQTEYFVDRRTAPEALAAVRALGESIAPHLLITELRTIAADDLWLSTANGRPSLAIHFTWKNEPEAVARLVPQIQAALAPFGARPHWGKVNTMAVADLAALYPRLAEFTSLAERLDPQHRFRNAYLERVLGLTD
ncbi:FAD-binding protein [Glaciihabitans sp. INWT7]|uniref:D-arabinono-1,4-lactone oxidase n=1 Tax=Glaciihabitans sp. INWT7 TaxID=2596912 RepID=UPI001628BCD1|nr:D-arabinono-1,4-lactone oxidase [Glaciihabitans sp. INWT7]QNE47614.1 FAD-binding protein [Glaciihabitans sp. INWT7]